MGKLTVSALRAVLIVVLTGTVLVQAGMVWVLVSGSVLGVALIVYVLRALLAQAVARDVEAAQLQAELDTVV